MVLALAKRNSVMAVSFHYELHHVCYVLATEKLFIWNLFCFLCKQIYIISSVQNCVIDEEDTVYSCMHGKPLISSVNVEETECVRLNE